MEENIKAPYTIFGKTKNVPLKVFKNGNLVNGCTEWDEDYWVETEECWYGLGSASLKDKLVRVIERNSWLRSEEIT